jgi:small subunit ribosomal protein S6
MRRYETIVIVDPDLSEEGRSPVFDRIKEIIPQQGGALIDIDDWGNKRLAYEIKKKNRGFYARLDYCGTGAVVDELERFFRIDDRLMKYLTIVIDEDADPEALLAEKAAAAEAAAAAETAAAEDAPETEATVAETPATDEEE